MTHLFHFSYKAHRLCVHRIEGLIWNDSSMDNLVKIEHREIFLKNLMPEFTF